MTENEFLFECIAMKGECPDCNTITLQVNGPFVQCKSCQAVFTVNSFYGQRVKSTDVHGLICA